MRSVEVVLDGQTVEINELRSRDNAAWRKTLQEGPLGELIDRLESTPLNPDLTDGAALGAVVRSVTGLVFDSVPIMQRLLAEYAPDHRELIDRAYDSEIAEAFTAVLGLAFPFGVILKRLRLAGLQQQLI